MDVAMEVHNGGNETEAKDRLRQALRFGARKVVIVSVPAAVTRLRNICRFEAELKNWLAGTLQSFHGREQAKLYI